MVDNKNLINNAKFSVNDSPSESSKDRRYSIRHVAKMIGETESIVIGWRDKLCAELHLEDSQQLFNEDEINRFKLVKNMKRNQNMKLLDIKRALDELSDLDSFTDDRMINNESNGLLIQQIVKSAVQVEVANMMNDLKVSIVSEMSNKIDQHNKSIINATMETKKQMYELNNSMMKTINDTFKVLENKMDDNSKLIPSSDKINDIDDKLGRVKNMMEVREQESKKSFWSRIFNK